MKLESASRDIFIVIQHGELEGRLHFVGALLKYSA
jgi:hypothetical protein